MNSVKIDFENPPKTPSKGDIYISCDTPYILACVGKEYVLISLLDGNRFTEPSNINNIWGDTGRGEFKLFSGTLTIKTIPYD